MTMLLRTLIPVLILGGFSLLSLIFVEKPIYPVSPFHPVIVFLFGISGWYAYTLSLVRKSYALMATSMLLFVLSLCGGVYPNYWLRHPEATLSAMACSQLFLLLCSGIIFSRNSKLVLLILAVSLLPVNLPIYMPVEANSKIILTCLSLLVLTGSGIYSWKQRQRRLNAVTICVVIFFITLTGFLALLSFRLFIPLPSAGQIDGFIMAALLALGGVLLSDQVNSEQGLRSGAHMNLDASLKDSLTGLANRRALETFGSTLISQSYDAGKAISLIMMDIDNFKQINDIHGHPFGDIVLQKTSRHLSNNVRKSDLVARFGGEEFVILLPGSPLAPALRLAERMRAAIEAEIVSSDNISLKRTASFGVTTAFPENPASLSELIDKADANLYRAKRDGRNQVKADRLEPEQF